MAVDPALIGRAQRGDAAALEAVLRALAPYLGRICGAIALDAGDDALQEAMVAVARNLGRLREPAAIRGWPGASRCARPCGRHAAAARCRSTLRTSRPWRPVPDAATAVEVRAVLDQLAPEQRAVLVLRHLDGLDEAEMAEALGVARGTVKSRLHRARGAFRERWTA